MPNKATILFAYANPENDLKLENEYNPIRKASYADKARRIASVPQAIFNTQIADLSTTFLSFKEQLAVFHFAGHGDHHILSLQDKDIPTHPFNDLLELQPNLHLVFLNGCNTDLQARELVTKIPVVIGTNNVIDDEVVSQFSSPFTDLLQKFIKY
ncbi:MAG TPA: hypothetical protein DCS93_41715 [Microscillaceae bacterium]|nr:hypothetical protein [Microscillaceae bacterium]